MRQVSEYMGEEVDVTVYQTENGNGSQFRVYVRSADDGSLISERRFGSRDDAETFAINGVHGHAI